MDLPDMPIWGIHICPLSRLGFAPPIDCLRILLYLRDYPRQQRRSSPVAVAAKLTGQGKDRSGQRVFVHRNMKVALRHPPLLHQRKTLALWRWFPRSKGRWFNAHDSPAQTHSNRHCLCGDPTALRRIMIPSLDIEFDA